MFDVRSVNKLNTQGLVKDYHTHEFGNLIVTSPLKSNCFCLMVSTVESPTSGENLNQTTTNNASTLVPCPIDEETEAINLINFENIVKNHPDSG